MRIAVCINNDTIRNRLCSLLEDYRVKNSEILDYRSFENDTQLMCELIGGEYDAIFLDPFENMSGLVEELREKDKSVRLIPVAQGSKWITKSYGKEIWYCLPAPVSQTFLFTVLDRLASDLMHDTNAGIVVKSRKGVIYIAFASLEYVEVASKTVCFHLLGGKIETVPASLSEYEAPLLNWPDFVKVHRAYIVNLRYIQKIELGNVITHSGHSVPVSKAMFTQLKRDYMCMLMDPEVSQPAPDFPKAGNRHSAIPPTSNNVDASSNSGYSVLLVDDEEDQRIRWTQVLISHGCRVTVADCKAAALAMAEKEPFDCVVLDVRLGNDNGFDFCGLLKEHTNCPVVFLSSLTDSHSQSQGFLSGGIDYITKDTPPGLFWLKIETRMKMAHSDKYELYQNNLCIDLKNRRVFLESKEVSLTTVEFDLLLLLFQHPGSVYSPARLYSLVWGSPQWDDGQTVQLHLSQLRRKLEAIYPNHSFIETIWGKGYCFIPED